MKSFERIIAPMLSLFMLFLFSIQGFGQTTVTIGTGTAQSYNSPVYISSSSSSYYYSNTIALYTAAELTGNSGDISKLAWNKSTTEGYILGNATMRIYLKETTATSVSTTSGTFLTELTGATLVYESFTQSLPQTTGWLEFTLATVFNYSGANNLMVLVDWYRPGSPTGAVNWYYTDNPGLAATFSGTSANPSFWSGTGNTRPNIQITFQPSLPDDAGITGIVSPASPAIPGNNPVHVTLKNFGINNLNNVTINWSVDGAPQAPFAWNGTLAPGTTVTVNLGTANFPQGIVPVVASTQNPNGNVDSNPLNDQFSGQVVACNPLVGTFTIGTGGDVPDVDFAIQALMMCGVGGPVTFNVLPGNGPFTGGIEIGAIPGISATNTVTFNGNGAIINESTATYILAFNGVSYFTLNNFQIINTTPATNIFGIMVRGGSQYLSITNNYIDVGITSTSTATAGIAVSGSTTSAVTAGNNAQYLNISGNEIVGGNYGITLLGQDPYLNNFEQNISDNIIKDFRSYGIYLNDAENCIVTGNNIYRQNRTSVTTTYGIYLNTSRNIKVVGNQVHSTGTNSSTTYPIYITTSVNTPGQETEIVNNAIYNIQTSGIVYGIYLLGTRDYLNIYHNTVHLDVGNGTKRALFASTAPDNHRVVNNIFNVQGSGTGTKYCIYLSATSTSYYGSNNILHMGATAGTNYTGYYAATNLTTLADWQTATGQDANSLALDPLFPSATSFTPQSYHIDNLGTYLSSVPTDIDGVIRHLTTPDIGALEFFGTSMELSLSGGSGCDNSQLVVPIDVANFTNIGALSICLNVDATGLMLNSLQNIHANLGGMIALQDGNKVRISWVSPTGTGVSMPNGTMVELVFNTLAAGTYNITWNLSDPGETEIVGPTGSLRYLITSGDAVTIINCVTINGVVRYNNEGNSPPIAGAPSPLNNVHVVLQDGSKANIAETYTNASGQYNFTDIPLGTYALKLTTVKAWGGANSVDALAIMKHFVGMPPLLTGIRLLVSDVDRSGFTNSGDALQVSRRFVGQISSFASGNWGFETDTFPVLNPGPPQSISWVPKDILFDKDTTLNIYGLCYGDCNGSFTPPATKAVSSVKLGYFGKMQVSNGQEVNIPIYTQVPMSFGAVSLVLQIPAGLDITGIEMNTQDGHLDWGVMDNELRISWFSLEPTSSSSSQALFHIQARVKDVNDTKMVVSDGSELADAHATSLTGTLVTPKLSIFEEALGLSVYPNPMNSTSSIQMDVPEDGMLRLELVNALGATVKVLKEGHITAGQHQQVITTEGLKSGVYLLRLQNNEQTSTTRLIVR